MIGVEPPLPMVLIVGVVAMLASGVGIAALLLDGGGRRPPHPRRYTLVEHERDIASALGWRWRAWVTMRLSVAGMALALGCISGVWVLAVILVLLGIFGVRFAVEGRAARQRLAADRAFAGMLRELRDRMAISNQSLDTALMEMAATPPPPLASVLQPLMAGGDIAGGIVALGERSRSPLIEQGCGVLLWARTRSLDALIDTVDDVLLPVGSAQLAVEEEALVTLAQQRAVSFAMCGLLVVMFASVVRVDSFRAYYQSLTGGAVLLVVAGLFAALIAVVGRIARVGGWTRWDLRRLIDSEAPDRA